MDFNRQTDTNRRPETITLAIVDLVNGDISITELIHLFLVERARAALLFRTLRYPQRLFNCTTEPTGPNPILATF